jgi:hypothetical protein
MISTGNSEIGCRKASAEPSLFRAICMNGNIWGRIRGSGLVTVHRGQALDFIALEHQILKGLNEQIPLIPQGIDVLLNTRKFGWDGDSIRPLIAQTANRYGFSVKETDTILHNYKIECQETPVNRKTLFGLINGVTRAAQELPPERWERFNTVSGELMEFNENAWKGHVSAAKGLSLKEVMAAFSDN